ncbi:Heat shock protein C [Cupriavidus sp. H18C1]|uniref:hypothetical protein n=1 Tax=Cupriavidus sp. H18C1 TaxID=3241601 RepID=UPI003BB8F665
MARPYFPPVAVEGELIDFAHLEPFSLAVESRLAKKTLRMHVTFSNHCFTKRCLDEMPGSRRPIFDGTTNRPRAFCPARYRLSRKLPSVIRALNHPKAKVWQTSSRRNWAYSMTVEGPKGPYHVFFEVRRPVADRRRSQDLNLIVESAYHQTERAPVLLGSIGFVLLCGKVYLGHPVATKR